MKIFIFSGFNPRAVLSFVRLAEDYGLDICIIAKDKYDPILFTAYKNHVKLIRESNNLDLNTIMQIANSFRKKDEQVFVLPSTEYLNRVLSKNLETLKRHNIFHGLVNYKTYSLLSDKLSFCKLCEKFNISIPKTYINLPELPYVLKPKHYLNSSGKSDSPKIILDKHQELYHLKNNNLKDFFIQDYIYGESVYMLCFASKDNNISIYGQKNYIQQSNGGSIILARSSSNFPNDIILKTKKMLSSINFFGLIMIEFRKTDSDFVMIEANPRIWGPAQLVIDSGMDLFDLFLLENNLITQIKKRKYKDGTEYLWSGGMSDNQVFLVDSNSCSYSIDSDVYNREDSKEYFTYEKTQNSI